MRIEFKANTGHTAKPCLKAYFFKSFPCYFTSVKTSLCEIPYNTLFINTMLRNFSEVQVSLYCPGWSETPEFKSSFHLVSLGAEVQVFTTEINLCLLLSWISVSYCTYFNPNLLLRERRKTETQSGR